MTDRYPYLALIANAMQPADNDRSRAVYARKPTLPAVPDVDSIASWLQWNDRNGDYLGLELAEAIDLLADVVEDAAADALAARWDAVEALGYDWTTDPVAVEYAYAGAKATPVELLAFCESRARGGEA